MIIINLRADVFDHFFLVNQHKAEGEDKVRVNNILKKISQTRSELSKLAPDKAFPKSEAEIIEFKKQTNAK